MEPPRGRGRPSGARESQVFFVCIRVTNIVSKIHLDIITIIITFTTEEHYIIEFRKKKNEIAQVKAQIQTQVKVANLSRKQKNEMFK